MTKSFPFYSSLRKNSSTGKHDRGWNQLADIVLKILLVTYLEQISSTAVKMLGTPTLNLGIKLNVSNRGTFTFLNTHKKLNGTVTVLLTPPAEMTLQKQHKQSRSPPSTSDHWQYNHIAQNYPLGLCEVEVKMHQKKASWRIAVTHHSNVWLKLIYFLQRGVQILDRTTVSSSFDTPRLCQTQTCLSWKWPETGNIHICSIARTKLSFSNWFIPLLASIVWVQVHCYLVPKAP